MELNWRTAQRAFLQEQENRRHLNQSLIYCQKEKKRFETKAVNQYDQILDLQNQVVICKEDNNRITEDYYIDSEAKQDQCDYEKQSIRIRLEDEISFIEREMDSCKWDMEQIVEMNNELEDRLQEYAELLQQAERRSYKWGWITFF